MTNQGVNASGVTTVQVNIVDKLVPTPPNYIRASSTSAYTKLRWGPSSDGDGEIAGYDLYLDGNKIASTGTQRTYSDVPLPGDHVYSVRARDTAGNLSALTPNTSVTVDGGPGAGPDIDITDPMNNAHVGGSVVISATASGNGSQVRRMSVFVDGRKRTTRTGSTINYSWDTTRESVGSHTIEVSATDYAGATNSDEIKLRN